MNSQKIEDMKKALEQYIDNQELSHKEAISALECGEFLSRALSGFDTQSDESVEAVEAVYNYHVEKINQE